jgi:hypothetical protein
MFAELDSSPGLHELKPQVLHLVMKLLSCSSAGRDVTSTGCPENCRECEITFSQFVTAGSPGVVQRIPHCHQGGNYFVRHDNISPHVRYKLGVIFQFEVNSIRIYCRFISSRCYIQ